MAALVMIVTHSPPVRFSPGRGVYPMTSDEFRWVHAILLTGDRVDSIGYFSRVHARFDSGRP
jgi:hypothetical protein